MFFSPFGIAIISLGEDRDSLGAFRAFVRFALVWFCRFPLPLGVWEGFVIVALPGHFSYLIFNSMLLCGLFYGEICFKCCLLLFCSCIFQSF